MKKISAIVIALVLLVTLVVPSVVLAGNLEGGGTLSGPHYNLNIIGLPKGVEYDHNLNANFDGGNGARIFISRKGTTQIYVQGRNEPFQILDHDGTDGVVGTAGNPGSPGIILPYDGGVYRCDVYVRIQGPNGSSIKWQGAYYEAGSYVPIGTGFTLTKDGSSKFSLKNLDLLADGYENLLWTLDNKTKFRICQVRIYVDEGY